MNIGLYFGSFNPIHIGHLIIANHMLEFVKFNQIWFIVSPQSPFKTKSFLINDYHRFKMVSLAISDFNNMKVSNLEFKLPKPSYTINTLNFLEKKNKKYKFSLIIGSDTLLSLNKWKQYQYIVNKYTIYVYPRIYYNYKYNINLINAKIIYLINAPIIDISASFIRKSIINGNNISPMIPEKSWKYLNNNCLFIKNIIISMIILFLIIY